MSDEPQPQSLRRFDSSELSELERTAVRLARAAGERICAALARPIAVEFKTPTPGSAPDSNPVSEVDHEVEAFIRAELMAQFPDHAVIGEEGGASAGGEGLTWVIDPVDGTTNYINGLPLFASSVGVLCDGWPLAGAIWCVSTHALRPGVYHARRGGTLHFDEAQLPPRPGASWRGIAAEPGWAPRFGRYWDTRVLGSATLECAFVAAGILRLAHVSRPSLWDAAASLVLLEAAGRVVMTLERSQWVPLRRFVVDSAHGARTATLAGWCQPLLTGADAETLSLALQS